MPQNSGDDRTEPTLELPSLKLPGLGRRRKEKAPPPEPRPAPTSPEPTPPPAAEKTQRQPVTEVQEVQEVDEPLAPEAAAPARRRSTTRRPAGPAAAALAGAVVGLAGGAGTYAALAACEAVRGVSSCGGAPGFFVLLAIVTLMVLLGSALLKALAVTDPGSTSFLAVGIVAVLSMLFLLDVMDSPWMFVVVPALSAGAYLLAHWVTSRYADESTGRQDWM